MKNFSLKYKLLVSTLIALFVWALAADIPFSFKAGDVISAEQMNQNFTALNTAKQERITGTCAAGSAIRVIDADGKVTCEVDDIGSGSGAGVDAINGQTGAITLQAGDNITIDDSTAGQIKISALSNSTTTNNHDHFGQTWTGAGDSGLTIVNTQDRAGTASIIGRSGAGSNIDIGPDIAGVWGDGERGAGVWGTNIKGPGVFGVSQLDNGVYGVSSSSDGVHGISSGSQKAGVSGSNSNGYGVIGDGKLVGVYGQSNTGYGIGGFSPGGIGGSFGGATGVRATASEEAQPDLLLGGTSGIIKSSDLLLQSDGSISLQLDQDNNSVNTFNIKNGAGSPILSVAESGDAIIAGTLIQGSDRTVKHDIQAIDKQAILDKVAALPLSSWRYNSSADAKHIGPMAQDFYAAFGLGSTDKGIAAVDADGISLAAIQGLYQIVQEQQLKIAELEARLEKSQ